LVDTSSGTGLVINITCDARTLGKWGDKRDKRNIPGFGNFPFGNLIAILCPLFGSPIPQSDPILAREDDDHWKEVQVHPQQEIEEEVIFDDDDDVSSENSS
jgi:hypothetical protein